MFDKTQKFVEDTQYFYTIIQTKDFYNRNGFFYQQTMVRLESYCDVNEDELIKEVNSSPLQTCFDDYKRLLNNIDIPNVDTLNMSLYIQEHLTSDREILADAICIFETIVERCGNLRNTINSFMELYSLKDNYPKQGFLRPLYYDNVMTQETPILTLSTPDKSKEDPRTWDEYEYNGIEPYRIDYMNGKEFKKVMPKIHTFLIEKKVIDKRISLNYFMVCVRKAKYERIYNISKSKHNLIFVAKEIAKASNDEEQYKIDAALSMGFENVKKWQKTTASTEGFRTDFGNIVKSF